MPTFYARFPKAAHILLRNQKGGIILPETGYIQIRAFTSQAQLPLQGVAVTITADDGTAIAMRISDRSGKITPVTLPTPDASESQSPGDGQPFATVTVHAQLSRYEAYTAQSVQVFPGVTTVLDLEMIPLSELPEQWTKRESYDTPAQNL